VPVSSPLLKPVDLYTVTEFPGHLMVRAANMKITVDRKSLVIVNIPEADARMFPTSPAR
jgi:hypothetical protein